MSRAAQKELAYRNQNGLEVTLLWDPRSNEVSVEVADLWGAQSRFMLQRGTRE